MTDIFSIFMLLSSLIIPLLTTWIVLKKIYQYEFLINWGPVIVLCSMFIGIGGPFIATKWYLVPNYGTQETFAAKELQEENNEGKITQYLVYENGDKINLTQKTGQYYTELPDSKAYTEYLKLLWVVEWKQTYYSGLDFVDRK